MSRLPAKATAVARPSFSTARERFLLPITFHRSAQEASDNQNRVRMAPAPEEKGALLGYGSLVGALVAAHLIVLFFWFFQLAKGTPGAAGAKKHQ